MSCSDHKALFLEIKTNTFDRGPGIWRFNNSLLQDEQYLKEINQFIDNFVNLNKNKDPCIKWELMKNELKTKTTQYCTLKNQRRFSETKYVMNEINTVSELLTHKPRSRELQEKLSVLQQKYELLSINQIRGAQVRSRVKFIEEGEKNN